MGYTVDAIGDRVSPRRMVERRTDRIRSSLRNVKHSIMGSADYGTQQTRHRTTSAAAGVAGATTAVADGVTDAAAAVGHGASDMASSAVDAVRSAPQVARQETAGNPLAAGMLAFAAGALLASVLPQTEVEQRAATAVTPAIEPVKEQIKQAGQEVGEHLKNTVASGAEALKEQASDAAHQVKDEATHATQDVTRQATTVADEIKNNDSGADDAPAAAMETRTTQH